MFILKCKLIVDWNNHFIILFKLVSKIAIIYEIPNTVVKLRLLLNYEKLTL